MDAADADVEPEGEVAGSKHGQLRDSLTNVVVEAVRTSERMSRRMSSQLRAGGASRLRPDSKLQLHGRDGDVEALRYRLRTLSKSKDRGGGGGDDGGSGRDPEMLLVSGASGCGKSALVMRGLRDPADRMGLVFASGKFDQSRIKAPLSAVAQAMAVLAGRVADHERSREILREIREELGDEDLALIADALPGTGSMLMWEDERRASGEKLRQGSSERLVKVEGEGARLPLQFAVRRLLKVVCSNLKGLVLFLDDLQWSDTASLEMLTRIALDRDIPSILVAGAYREDEVSNSHPLTLQLREGAQLGISTTTINIGNLSPAHVTSLVADVLMMEDHEEAVSTLAATVHKKTDGNPFFVLLFLRSLANEELLRYNFAMGWQWDDKAVKAKLVTQNVATALVDLLRSSLSDASQNTLKVAACLGTSFSPEMVALALEEQGDVSSLDNITRMDRSVSSDISDCIDELEEAGLLERESDEVLRFAHDQVQLSSLNLIPPKDRPSFKSKLGDVLMKKIDADSLDDHLFEVVSLRNASIDLVPSDERVSMAKMNLRAGVKAAKNGSFDTAETYFKAGRELLGDAGWKDEPNMTVQLYSEGANACLVCSDFETMDRLIYQVLAKDISIEAKFQCYAVKIRSLTAASNWASIIDIGMDVRKQLGLPVMKNKPVPLWKLLREYGKTDKMLKKVTSDDIATMPQLEDTKLILGQLIIERILAAAYHSQPTMFPMMIFDMVQTSIRHGNNSSSCLAFAAMGMLYQSIFGNPSKASDLAVTAELLLNSPEVQDAARVKSQSIHTCYGFLHHWHSPIQQTLAPFIEGYQAGLFSGNTEFAAYCLSARASHLLYAGRPLRGMQHELESFSNVCAQLNQTPAQNATRADLLCVRKLRDSDNGEDSFEAISASAKGDSAVFARTVISRMELFVLFQDWSSASQLVRDLKEDPRASLVGAWVYVRYTFLESLVSFKAAQVATSWTTKRRWKKRGLKLMKQLGKWTSKGGNPNIVHNLHVLTAELAAMKGDTSRAKESFKKGALVATTNGFLHDKGLAHALASSYYSGRGDQYWADYHGEKSQDAFREWGATALLTN